MTDSTQDQVIVRLDRANRDLCEAVTIQETKQILDVASAAELYARRHQLGEDAVSYAHAIKVGALRRLGEMLRETPDAKTGPKPKQLGSHVEPNSIPTLVDLGIDKKTSMIAQQLAGLPQALFEQVRDGAVPFKTALREARPANITTVAWSPDAFKDLLRPLIKRQTGSNQNIAAALRDLADEVEEADDPDRREAASIARDELDVRDAEPGGYRIFESAEEAATHPGSPNVIASCKSTYPRWYSYLTTRKPGIAAMRQRQVKARLADILGGKLPTKCTAQTYWAVVWAIKDLPRTSPLSRGGM